MLAKNFADRIHFSDRRTSHVPPKASLMPYHL
jgi:hypothetical protein